MALVTKAQIRSAAARTRLAKNNRTADAILKEEASAVRSSYDIFLSHSYLDKTDILGVKEFIEGKGHTVYVDWIDDKQLDRSKVDKSTAAQLRAAMKKCACLIYAYSPNITNSRWCPWELGYFDGYNGSAFVMPIVENQSETYGGTEYVGLYNRIEEHKSNRDTMELFAVIDRNYKYLGGLIDEARKRMSLSG